MGKNRATLPKYSADEAAALAAALETPAPTVAADAPADATPPADAPAPPTADAIAAAKALLASVGCTVKESANSAPTMVFATRTTVTLSHEFAHAVRALTGKKGRTASTVRGLLSSYVSSYREGLDAEALAAFDATVAAAVKSYVPRARGSADADADADADLA